MNPSEYLIEPRNMATLTTVAIAIMLIAAFVIFPLIVRCLLPFAFRVFGEPSGYVIYKKK